MFRTRRGIRHSVFVVGVALSAWGCGDQDQAREAGERRFAEVERNYRAAIEARLQGVVAPVPAEGATATSASAASPSPESGTPRAPEESVTPAPVATTEPAALIGATPLVQELPPAPTIAGAGAIPAAITPTPAPLQTPTVTPAVAFAPLRTPYPMPARAAAAPSLPTPPSIPGVNPEPSPQEPPGSDAEPPMLRGLRFEPAEAPDGSEVSVVVQAVDNISGVASASGSLSSPSRKIYIPFSLALTGADGATLSGRFQIPPRSEAGAWTLSSLRLTDKAHNTVVLTPREHPVIATARLNVFSAGTDTNPPRLESIEISPQADDGGSVSIKLRVVDDESTVGSVRGILANPSRSVQLNFYPRLNPESGLYEGTVSLPKHSEFGDWQVTLLTLTDSANNRATLTLESDEKLKTARVNVSSATSDTSPPQVLSIELTPGRVADRGSVELVIGAIDDLSGVKGVDGWMVSPNKSARIHFSLRLAEPGLYRGTLKVPPSAANGLWAMERLTLSDQAGNRNVLSSTDPQLQGAGFEVYASP